MPDPETRSLTVLETWRAHAYVSNRAVRIRSRAFPANGGCSRRFRRLRRERSDPSIDRNPALRANGRPGSARRITHRFALRDHRVQERDAVGRNLAACDSRLDGAIRLAVVAQSQNRQWPRCGRISTNASSIDCGARCASERLHRRSSRARDPRSGCSVVSVVVCRPVARLADAGPGLTLPKAGLSIVQAGTRAPRCAASENAPPRRRPRLP